MEDSQSSDLGQVSYQFLYETDNMDEIRQLFREYEASIQVDLCFQQFAEELASLPGQYRSPGGALLLAVVDGQPAGCVAMHRLTEEICEMKRLFLRHTYRGLGIGKSLVNRMIEEAVERGYRFMRLDTLPCMQEAQQLYEALGFVDIEPYVFNPIQGARYMELKLPS